MLTFSPPELEKSLRAAIAMLGDAATLSIADEDLTADFESADLADQEITTSSEIGVYIDRCEEVETISLASAIGLVDEVRHTQTTFDGLAFHSNKRTVLSINPLDARTASMADALFTDGDMGAQTTLTVGPDQVTVGLIRRSLHFAIALVANNYYYDKYFPPMLHGEFFVEVRHEKCLDLKCVNGLAYAYLFELHSTLGLSFAEAARPEDMEDYSLGPEDDELSEFQERAKKLRPLLQGPGMPIILREFNLGVTDGNPGSAIVCYVKCMEYVSATVVREQQYEDLRKRLMSTEALNPTAAYMDGLLALFEESRKFAKDHAALKLTIEKCCDAILLSKHAPAKLPVLLGLSQTSKPADRSKALAELAACLSATRNQLAHAKANYTLTGLECPENEFAALAGCAKLAAEQCIRWYAAQNPDLRRA